MCICRVCSSFPVQLSLTIEHTRITRTKQSTAANSASSSATTLRQASRGKARLFTTRPWHVPIILISFHLNVGRSSTRLSTILPLPLVVLPPLRQGSGLPCIHDLNLLTRAMGNRRNISLFMRCWNGRIGTHTHTHAWEGVRVVCTILRRCCRPVIAREEGRRGIQTDERRERVCVRLS